VPVKPDAYLHVTLAGVKDGDFTLVVGNPANTNRYRESYSAAYNLRKGIPDQIRDLEANLALLRKYAAMKPEYQVALQSQIFGLANTLAAADAIDVPRLPELLNWTLRHAASAPRARCHRSAARRPTP